MGSAKFPVCLWRHLKYAARQRHRIWKDHNTIRLVPSEKDTDSAALGITIADKRGENSGIMTAPRNFPPIVQRLGAEIPWKYVAAVDNRRPRP
jgi:hypothetical protein